MRDKDRSVALEFKNRLAGLIQLVEETLTDARKMLEGGEQDWMID